MSVKKLLEDNRAKARRARNRIINDRKIDATCRACTVSGQQSREVAVECKRCPWNGTALIHEHPTSDDGTTLGLMAPCCPSCKVGGIRLRRAQETLA